MIKIPSLLRQYLPTPKVLTLSLLTLCGSQWSQAADYYFLPDSVGSNNGTSFDNAYGWSDFGIAGMAHFLNQTMGPGDRMLIGSGTFDGQKLTITTSGTAANPKEIIGVDTGAGLPLLTKGSWSPTSPSSGNYSLIQFDSAGIDYWKISGLELQGAQYAIYSPNASAPSTNIHLSDIQISRVRHGIYVSNLDDSSIENVRITHYTKHAFRLEKGCNNLEFIDCLADLSNGDTSWWDDSEAIPFGFNILGSSGAPNTNIT